MRKNLILIGLLFITSNAFATENEWLIGIETGKSKINGTATNTSSKGYGGLEGTHHGIKIGRYFNKNIRLYGTYYDFNDDATVDTSAKAVALDYLMGDGDIKAFVGLNATQYSLEYKNNKITEMAYGVQAGALYKIDENVDIEAGYRYLDTDSSITINNTQYHGYDFESWYGGLNYSF